MEFRRLLLIVSLSAPLAACGTVDSEAEPAVAASSAAIASDRTDFVVAHVKQANAALSTTARGEKYAAMKESAFAFYRGTNPLFFTDHGTSPELSAYGGKKATRVWLSGDMHVDNTGAFDDDQGEVVFGINDFDEATIGDYQLDVWRMAVSLVLVARRNGFSAANQGKLVDAFTEHYLDTMASYVGTDAELERRFVAGNTYGLLDDFLADAEDDNSRLEMLDDWTVTTGGVRRFDAAAHPDLATVTAAVKNDIKDHMASYRGTLSGGGASLPASAFTVKSVAKRLHAGLGSLGVTRYYVLIEGPTASQNDDRILDVKAQGEPSAWTALAPAAISATDAACAGNMALRTVIAQKAMGVRVDDTLGWMSLSDGKTYSVRERSPYKETFDTAELTTMTRFSKFAEQWGQVLATQHARADDDWNDAVFGTSVEAAIDGLTDGDHEGFRAKVRTIAAAYADQVAFDYASFVANF